MDNFNIPQTRCSKCGKYNPVEMKCPCTKILYRCTQCGKTLKTGFCRKHGTSYIEAYEKEDYSK